MSFGTLLFSPSGRIGPGNFWRGFIVAIAVNLVANVIAFIAGVENVATGLVSGVVWLVTMWWTFCVMAKRLHDSGASGGWAILAGGVWFIVFLVVFAVITAVFASEQFALAMKDQTYGQSAQFQLEVTQRTFVPATAANLVLSIVLGFIMASLRSDPVNNQYGPPPSGLGSTFDDSNGS